jgi:Outer membrane lipoprotein carrier protein LolA-like
MSVLRRFALAAALAVTAQSVTAADDGAFDVFAQVGARLNKYPVVRAEFVQTQRIAALKRPLVSSGRLLFSRRHGVLWQIEQPYRIAYILAEDRMIEIAADGTRRSRAPREVPGLAEIGRIFRAILGADAASLRNYFEATSSGDAAKWEVVLVPRQAQLAQFLQRLQLAGGEFVETIRIEPGGDDFTRIDFRKSRGDAALTDVEAQLFGRE